ncbi:Long-chain-fatty-acid--CoA ligase [Corynebacterium ciconiae DSM 44920]|uniref:long-chain-fatty-acid--CoA ligase n=1 Tax=Corynebacterium ciconiae TaxID=227319 RepID=UPI0003635D6F|nr:long-chain-fatty-acid--CoA ligase [Corynebacterium ciconiae]WKD62080.1 Long-chain-fatty-acid--CoA ligase [Corynebacterium ciconiae DSM 44920]
MTDHTTTPEPGSKPWLKYYAEWTPHTLDYGETTLLDLYDNNLQINGGRPATYFFGKSLTFSEFDTQVRACAAGLRALGVRKGDCVAIMLPNCPQHLIAFYAVLKLGATVVEHNPLYTSHELEPPFADHGAHVAICWDKAASVLESLRGSTSLETIVSVNMINAMPLVKRMALRVPLPSIRKTRKQLSAPARNSIPWETLLDPVIGGDGAELESCPDVTPETVALILYTSGTTGRPKGAQLTHGNLFANLLMGKSWVEGLGEHEERMLAALPMFHAYGMTMVATLAFFVGAQVLLLPSPDLKLIMDVVKKKKPTWLPGVPTLYERIVEASQETGIDISCFRNAFSGASTLPVSVVQAWEEYTNGRLVEGYGLTECSPILIGNPMTSDRRPGYVGVPFPDTEIRIANPENLDETQPYGVEGEVLARGPQIFAGYLNNKEATEAAFHNGWFRTGDVGFMDEDGFVKLVSRLKEMIITGGFNVYPAEVEDVLQGHSDVTDCAVVGMPRGDGSENVTAAITLAEGATLDPDSLKAFCRKNLTRYKVPRVFYHFEELPRDQLGKIRRRDVQQLLVERYGSENEF